MDDKLVTVIDNQDNKIRIIYVDDNISFRLELDKYNINKTLKENEYIVRYAIKT